MPLYFKQHLDRIENCRNFCCCWWWFEKIGNFLSKCHCWVVWSLCTCEPSSHGAPNLAGVGGRYLTGDNLEVVRAEFSIWCQAVLLDNTTNDHSAKWPLLKVENSAQVLSCYLKFVHELIQHVFETCHISVTNILAVAMVVGKLLDNDILKLYENVTWEVQSVNNFACTIF